MNLNELLSFLSKTFALAGQLQLEDIKLVGANKYEISIYSDWDVVRYYTKTFTICGETGETSKNFEDEIEWDIEVKVKEQLELNEMQKRRQAVLDKLSDEEKELLGL
jgi:hypothetical protein